MKSNQAMQPTAGRTCVLRRLKTELMRSPADDALSHLLEVPAGITRADLRFDPMWNRLRRDPRFAKLCQEPTI